MISPFRKYNLLYDRNVQPIAPIPQEVINRAGDMLPEALKDAMKLAKENIRRFHEVQGEPTVKITTTEGVTCWRESRPVDSVGLYIPGGSAPLFSTVLMLGVPAVLAGCGTITLCTPADAQGQIPAAILYAAQLAGITTVYGVGGIQAIAAMSKGAGSIPKADKIFGPENQYVTAAKQLAQQLGTAIDLPAGPSELLVIADESCNPEFVAADLLSQAEHGPDSQVMLLSASEACIKPLPGGFKTTAGISAQERYSYRRAKA